MHKIGCIKTEVKHKTPWENVALAGHQTWAIRFVCQPRTWGLISPTRHAPSLRKDPGTGWYLAPPPRGAWRVA